MRALSASLLFLAILGPSSAAQGPAVSSTRRGPTPEAGAALVVPAPGTVKSFLRVDSIPGVERLGYALAHLGDVDGDGIGDLAVGDPYDSEGQPFSHRGAVHIVFLNADETVKGTQKINHLHGGFSGALAHDDGFGAAVSALGDFDGDGISELLVGAPQRDVLTPGYGRAWLLLLAADGTVKSQVLYSQGQGGFQETIREFDWFGSGFAPLGDIDGNGALDFAVARAWGPSSSNSYSFTLRLKPDGTVKNTLKVGPGLGGYVGSTFLDWGAAACGIPDLDGDGIGDYAIGDPGTHSGLKGEVVVLFPNPNATLHGQQLIRPEYPGLPAEGGFTGIVDYGDLFGASLTPVGDLDGDGIVDLAVGANGDTEEQSTNQTRYWGAVWILFLNSDGSVHAQQKISRTQGGWTPALQALDSFGLSVAAVGDRDGDGVPDLLVGAPGRGTLYFLYLNGK